ncbi:hypothetical protein [Acinetobacter junii]|uniref:hypothetical protein n=1 Tax=Acinetobacter junii TaxID=40215 RepID=UPI000F7579A3|nr:hypothetical protein [Acinetobacter junii]AZN69294.1 hypothetical protein DX910_14570 [Acinetobacter haemolyticus]RXS92956.1 hypothetical protein ETZ13_14235 [Acinetobacter junii]
MTFQLEPYQVFLILASVIGSVVGMVKVLGNQINSNIQQNFESTNQKIEEVAKQAAKGQEEIRALERQFLEFKADMPFRYIARDDYIRGQTVLESKLDAVAEKLEKVQIKQGVQP